MTLEEKNIRIVYDTESMPSRLSFDRRRLQQVILNLLTNAVKFTENGGNIKIKHKLGKLHRKKMRSLKVSVIDDGVGMSEEECQHVFDPNFISGSSSN